jgi:hypothetical protein
MAKGQRRSNREAKKPKQPKPERSVTSALPLAAGPAARERPPVSGRDQTGGRNGRR